MNVELFPEKINNNLLYGPDFLKAMTLLAEARQAINAGDFDGDLFVARADEIFKEIQAALDAQNSKEYAQFRNKDASDANFRDGVLEVDNPFDYRVSPSHAGAYIACWAWVPRENIDKNFDPTEEG